MPSNRLLLPTPNSQQVGACRTPLPERSAAWRGRACGRVFCWCRPGRCRYNSPGLFPRASEVSTMIKIVKPGLGYVITLGLLTASGSLVGAGEPDWKVGLAQVKIT